MCGFARSSAVGTLRPAPASTNVARADFVEADDAAFGVAVGNTYRGSSLLAANAAAAEVGTALLSRLASLRLDTTWMGDGVDRLGEHEHDGVNTLGLPSPVFAVVLEHLMESSGFVSG